MENKPEKNEKKNCRKTSRKIKVPTVIQGY